MICLEAPVLIRREIAPVILFNTLITRTLLQTSGPASIRNLSRPVALRQWKFLSKVHNKFEEECVSVELFFQRFSWTFHSHSWSPVSPLVAGCEASLHHVQTPPLPGFVMTEWQVFLILRWVYLFVKNLAESMVNVLDKRLPDLFVCRFRGVSHGVFFMQSQRQWRRTNISTEILNKECCPFLNLFHTHVTTSLTCTL